MGSSLARSLTANWIGQAVSVAVGLLVPAMVIRELGAEQYGIWALLISVIGQMSLLDIGTRHAVVRLTARLHGEGRDRDILRLVKVVVQAISILALLGLVIALGVAWYLDVLFVIPASELCIAQILLIFLALDAACDLLSGPYSSVLGGIERYDMLQVGNSVRMVMNALFVWLSLRCNFGLVGVAGSLLLSRLVYRLFLLATVHRLIRPHATTYNGTPEAIGIPEISAEGSNRKTVLREVFTFGVWTSIMIVGTRICYQIDLLVIGTLLSAAAVTTYAVPLILVDQVRAIVDSAQLVLFSRLSKLSCGQNASERFALLTRWIKYSLLLPLTVGIHLIVFGGDFISLWIGREIPESNVLLLFLLVPFFFSAPNAGIMALLLAQRRPQLVASVVVVEAILNLICSVALVSIFGVIGVAMGTYIATLVVHSIFAVTVYAKCREDSLREVRKSLIGTLCIAPFYCAVLVFFRDEVGSGTVMQFALGNGAPFLLLMGGIYVWVCDENDRGYLGRRFSASSPNPKSFSHSPRG